ncbi:MAG TPA: hypothetical protein PLV43_12020 [Aequorivita sp.]|nr:hypothetical protein [Aequorivita sp.]
MEKGMWNVGKEMGVLDEVLRKINWGVGKPFKVYDFIILNFKFTNAS